MVTMNHDAAIQIVTSNTVDWIEREDDGISPRIRVLPNKDGSYLKMEGEFTRKELEAIVFLMKEKEQQ